MWTDESFDEIQKGDTVYYETPQGQTHSGRGMLRGPAGWGRHTYRAHGVGT